MMNTSLSSLLQLTCNRNNKSYNIAIDVGAHYGDYAQFLIATGFFSHVLSFEPNPESYLKLLQEISATKICEFEAINSALNHTSGMLDLYSDEDTATASLLNYALGYQIAGKLKKHRVTVLTLDEYLIDHPINGRLELLKVDTQGNDLAVLIGAKATILVHRPVIQVEFIYIPLYVGQCSPLELTDALLHLGYEIYSLNNLHVTAEGRLAFCDAIFIPKELDIPVTQKYTCIDDQISYMNQIETLTKICIERLALIEKLDAEIRCLNMGRLVKTILIKVKSWVL